MKDKAAYLFLVITNSRFHKLCCSLEFHKPQSFCSLSGKRMYLNNMQFLFVKLVNIYELAVLGNPAARVSDEGHWNDYLIFLSVFGSLLVEMPRGAPKAQIAIKVSSTLGLRDPKTGKVTLFGPFYPLEPLQSFCKCPVFTCYRTNTQCPNPIANPNTSIT